MSKKQWIGIISVLAGLIILVVGVLYLTDSKEQKRDVVEEVGKETQQASKSVKQQVQDKLGLDYDLLLWDEMNMAVEEIQTKADKDGVVLMESDIEEEITKKYGELNGYAYLFDYLLDGTEDEITVNQVINNLMGVYYPEKEHVKDLKVIQTYNLVNYENSVREDGGRNQRIPVEVLEGSKQFAYLTADTEGFKEGKNFKIGYPLIKHAPIYFAERDDKYKQMWEMDFSVYLDKDMKLGKFLEKVQDIEVQIGDYKVKPGEMVYLDDMIAEHLAVAKEKGTQIKDEEVYKEYTKEEMLYSLLGINLADHPSVEMWDSEIEMDLWKDDTGLWDMTRDQFDTYQKHNKYLEKEKILQKGTYVPITVEIDKSAIVGDLGDNLPEDEYLYEEDYQDYFLKDGHEPPVVTIDGVDIKLQVATDKLINEPGIFYQQTIE